MCANCQIQLSAIINARTVVIQQKEAKHYVAGAIKKRKQNKKPKTEIKKVVGINTTKDGTTIFSNGTRYYGINLSKKRPFIPDLPTAIIPELKIKSQSHKEDS